MAVEEDGRRAVWAQDLACDSRGGVGQLKRAEPLDAGGPEQPEDRLVRVTQRLAWLREAGAETDGIATSSASSASSCGISESTTVAIDELAAAVPSGGLPCIALSLQRSA